MATHDLEFQVHNGDQRQQYDRGVAGELDHLPDQASNGGSLQYLQNQLKQSSHPIVIIFHIIFKAAALFLYIFGGFIVGSGSNGARFITLTVVCILLLAADFWVVKNVTGRLLVGLRWWNKVDEDETKWIFESAEDKAVNKFDRSVFWTVLYLTPAVWTAFLLLGILSFDLSWLLIVCFALSLSLANVYGYYKCSKEQAEQIQRMMQQGAQQGAVAMMRSNMLSLLTGTNSGNSGASNSSNGFT